MQSAVLHMLEFDRVREALALEADTPLGRARALGLEPLSDPAAVAAALDATSEAAAFLRRHTLSLEAPEDLADVLGSLEIADQPLLPHQLLGLARFVRSVETAAGRILAVASDASSGNAPVFPHLRALAVSTPSFEAEVAAIRRAIDPSGDVLDQASPALGEIRDQLRRQRAKLRSTLDALTRGRDTAKYLQDQIVTDRHGRYVVVVRAEHREAIPGIVHGGSASGASLYLEPMSTVPLNNEVVALADREREEVLRILRALSNAFRERAGELEALLDAAAALDELGAKARLARRVDGVRPTIARDGRIEFRGARHPLLLPAVRDLLDRISEPDPQDEGGRAAAPRPATIVASDLLVVPPTRALVISGPNTGGKTVALKAFGLLCLMAQAGLLIPVGDGSSFTPFVGVFADIGDEQSISASLSTFSARIANLVAMERALDPPALVLLDEVGSGTDPVEGGALGTAVIDHFRRRGATVVATTHDDALKSYAATTDGVATAAFGFHPDTYAPTYKLNYGAPGRSLALEIAQRLGMPADVIADARARRSGRESLLAAHVARIDLELARVAEERATLAAARAELAGDARRLTEKEARLTEREAAVKRRTGDRVNEALREARAEIDRVVAQLKEKARLLAEKADRHVGTPGAPVISTGEIGQLRAQSRHALAGIGDAADPLAPAETSDAHQELGGVPQVGQAVFVRTFAADGVVRAVHGGKVDVDVRGKRMRVLVSELEPTRQPSAATAAGRAPASRAPQAAGRPTPVAAATREVVVVGATVDEATDRVEKVLNAALLADERRVRIVHGRGTGRLRDGLRLFLEQHPLVASVARAADDEGGDAVTFVDLRD